MQPFCIVYRLVNFAPDVLRVLTGYLMKWLTGTFHWGFGDTADLQLHEASQMATQCFSRPPWMRYGKVYYLKYSEEEDRAFRQNKAEVQRQYNDAVRERREEMSWEAKEEARRKAKEA